MPMISGRTIKLGYMNDPRKDVADEMKWAGENGFDIFDFTLEHTFGFKADIEKIKDIASRYGLNLIGHTQPDFPYVFPLKEIREICFQKFVEFADIFSELGIKLMNIHPVTQHGFSHQRLIHDHIGFLKRLIPHVNERGLELMLETTFDPFDSVETFLQIVNAVPDLKIQLDIGHLHIGHKKDHLELIETFFQTFGSKIVYIHISDNDAFSDQHLPIGCGSIRWPEVVRILKKYQYNAGMTLEVYRVDLEYVLMSKQKIETLWDNL